MKRHFRANSEKLLGVFGLGVVLVLSGCSGQNEEENNQNKNIVESVKKGAFVILGEQKDGSYKVLEEYPSAQTRVIVRDINGNERILSDEEIKEVLKKAEEKIDNGTSNLTKSQSVSSGGLGLGEALLASAAGGILGAYIGNKLFGNSNFANARSQAFSSPSAYQRSVNNFSGATNATRGTPNTARSGFFGSSANTTRTTPSFGG